MPLGLPELLVILVIVLVVLGPKRLPRLGRQIGGALHEFKDSVLNHDDEPPSARAELTAGDPAPDAPSAGVAPASPDAGDEQRDAPRG